MVVAVGDSLTLSCPWSRDTLYSAGEQMENDAQQAAEPEELGKEITSTFSGRLRLTRSNFCRQAELAPAAVAMTSSR